MNDDEMVVNWRKVFHDDICTDRRWLVTLLITMFSMVLLFRVLRSILISFLISGARIMNFTNNKTLSSVLETLLEEQECKRMQRQNKNSSMINPEAYKI